MVREKIKMKKIEKPAARHVTFSKRRRGLFKKAQELAILCDVQVAVIVFSSTGKLYDFSTKSMKDIIKMYNKSLDDETKAEKSSSELQRKNIDFESQEEKMVKIDHQLRLLHEKDLEVSTLNELALLEKDLQKRLCHLLEKKGQKIMEEITGLKQKGAELMEENALLRQKVLKMTKGKWGVDLSEPAEISDADKHFSGSGTSTSSPSLTQDKKDHSDTNLTLGL